MIMHIKLYENEKHQSWHTQFFHFARCVEIFAHARARARCRPACPHSIVPHAKYMAVCKYESLEWKLIYQNRSDVISLSHVRSSSGMCINILFGILSAQYPHLFRALHI